MTGTEELINQLGPLSYLGIWIISILSNVFIPVPEEAVLLILGYLSGGSTFNGIILLPVVFSGLLISDCAMYFFSRRGNRLVSTFYDKVFAPRIESKREWINRHLSKVVFFSRFMVQLRFLGPFFAGQTGMPFRKFFFLDAAALLIYTPLYLFLGYYFRSRLEFILSGVGIVRNIIIIILLFFAFLSLSRYVRRRLMSAHEDSPTNNGK